jgi:hypothetical protein
MKDLMVHREGIYTEHSNKVGYLDTIYELRIPNARVLSPDSGRIFKLEFWTKLSGVGITLGAAGAGPSGSNEDYIARSALAAAAGGVPLQPYKANGDQFSLNEAVRIVYEGTSGGTATKGAVATLTPNTDTAKGYAIAATDTYTQGIDLVTVYYRPSIPGLFVLEYGQPDMLGYDCRQVMSQDTVTMMLNNPYHRDQFVPFRAPTVWPENWVVRMKLKAPWVVCWEDDLPTPAVPLPEWQIPVVVQSRNEFDATLEDRVRDSLIKIK